MTNFEWMRKRLLDRKGIFDPPKQLPDFATLQRTQWSSRFETLMRNRLLMGAFRYGLLGRQDLKYDAASDAKRRIDLYLHSGNTEHLVDAANMCLVEFVLGKHPTKHFEATDRD